MKQHCIDYWSNFAPEPAIILYRGEPRHSDPAPGDPNAFLVWEGYFDPIYTASLDRYGHRGIPNEFVEWNECRGWYECGSERLADPELTASILESLKAEDLKNVSNDSYVDDVEHCLKDLIYFIRESLKLDLPLFIHNGFFGGYTHPTQHNKTA